MKDYGDFLREELSQYRGDFDQYILYLPDFFDLLCQLMDTDIDSDARRCINSALAYLVLPNDFLPENVYGPEGYTDDIFVITTVLAYLIKRYGIESIEPIWGPNESFDDVAAMCFEKSTKMMEEKEMKDGILEYIGLEDMTWIKK